MTRSIAILLAAAVLAVVPSLAWTLERVDINSASIEELQKFPGIGSVRAAAIVAERAHSRFDTVDELARVDGVGKRLLVELRDHVTVAPGVSDK